MQIFDKKLKKYFPNYILQSLLATITLAIILYFENIFTHTAIIASLGATTFIIFAMPKYTTAQPRREKIFSLPGIFLKFSSLPSL